MAASRALFSDPTRLKVVAVVVDRNQSEQKLMRNPHNADMDAASWNPASVRRKVTLTVLGESPT